MTLPEEVTDEAVLALLAPLNAEQQAFVEVVGKAFAADPGSWPTFDHIEGTLEEQEIEARDVITSFPAMMVPSGYCAIWCESGWNTWPNPEKRVALTVLGMHHCDELRTRFPRDSSIPQLDLVRGFFTLIDLAAAQRRSVKPSPNGVRTTEIESGEMISELQRAGFYFDRLRPTVLPELMGREPPFWGGGSSIAADAGSWKYGITRSVKEFEGMTTIHEYMSRLALRQPPPNRPQLAAPSPFGLVAAIDYLDTTWQLVYPGKKLFTLDSAERVAKLSYPANTTEELNSRLSELGEVLISTRTAVTKGTQERGRPLSWLEAHLTNLLGATAAPRIARNVRTLEHVILVRDAGQHARARGAAAGSLVELGIGFPITYPPGAWEIIQAQTTEALGAIREELQAYAAARRTT